ncbi:MAG: MMPL family transporter [Acidimicrobiales bacterium]|nr:MMPL family transporter [Acidimicrobiales bacterium]
MFARLGRWCYRHRRIVAAAWFVGVLLIGLLSSTVGSAFRSDMSMPDVESRRGFDIVDEQFGGLGSGFEGRIVFRAEQGVTDPAVQAAMTAYFEDVRGFGDVELTSPYDVPAIQIASQGDEAGKIAYATVAVSRDMPQNEAAEIGTQMRDARPQLEGLQVEIGGDIFAEFEPPESELLGLAFAIFILVLAFGSVLAMGLPIGVALAGIGVGSGLIVLLSNVVSMPDFTTTLALMIGLGVGIDYALFIVTRFREGLHHGHSVEEATVTAIDTAGRAVTFAGTTVVISLLGMLVMGMAFVTGLAVGASVVVAVTMLASITLLPALLGFAGHRVEVTRWRGIIAASLVALALVGVALGIQPLLLGLPLAVVVFAAGFAVAPLRKELPPRKVKPLRETTAYRWSRVIQHHPWAAALGGAAVLLVLAIPFLGLRMGFSDEGNYPEETTTRKAYDLVADGFGPGYNGRLLLATELPDGTEPAALEQVTLAVQGTEGVAFASPAIPNDPSAPTAALWQVIPTSAPQDEATDQLVNRLRDDVLPAATEGTGLDVAVSGSTAVGIDFSSYLGERLPLFFGVVLSLSFVLLMVVFRSLLVPLKAVIMNLLSIAAAYGVVVAIFQWDWLGSLTGFEGAPVEPFVPMMMFAIVFGLSMDYEVFLLSRVKEEYDRTGDARNSVADGLAATARVITAAAAIMVFVFGSFLLEANRTVKLFGAGLAVAVFLDATVVRMLLVPATMELLGDRNWWLPRWLDRILPRIDVEGPGDEELEDLVEDLEAEEEREPAGV